MRIVLNQHKREFLFLQEISDRIQNQLNQTENLLHALKDLAEIVFILLILAALLAALSFCTIKFLEQSLWLLQQSSIISVTSEMQ